MVRESGYFRCRERVQRASRVQYNWRLVVIVVLRKGSSLWFDAPGASDGASLTVASKNDVLEACKKAVQSSIEPE